MRKPCALLAMCALAACSFKGGEAAERSIDTVGQRDSIAAVAAASMNELQTLGLLEYTHATDSALGALAAMKGATTELKDFGRMILREHHALRREVFTVAEGLGIAPTPPRVAADAPPWQNLAHLQARAPGLLWDQAYLDYAVALHRSALENSARALAATKSPETKRFIQRSVPILQKHLDKANALRKTLAKMQDTTKAPPAAAKATTAPAAPPAPAARPTPPKP